MNYIRCLCIVSQEGGMDIYIGGVPHRNAALHGDLVHAEMLPMEEWKVRWLFLVNAQIICIYLSIY